MGDCVVAPVPSASGALPCGATRVAHDRQAPLGHNSRPGSRWFVLHLVVGRHYSTIFRRSAGRRPRGGRRSLAGVVSLARDSRHDSFFLSFFLSFSVALLPFGGPSFLFNQSSLSLIATRVCVRITCWARWTPNVDTRKLFQVKRHGRECTSDWAPLVDAVVDL